MKLFIGTCRRRSKRKKVTTTSSMHLNDQKNFDEPECGRGGPPRPPDPAPVENETINQKTRQK